MLDISQQSLAIMKNTIAGPKLPKQLIKITKWITVVGLSLKVLTYHYNFLSYYSLTLILLLGKRGYLTTLSWFG